MSSLGSKYGIKTSLGRYGLAVLIVFFPLVVLSDYNPQLAVGIAAAVGLLFLLSWQPKIADLLRR